MAAVSSFNTLLLSRFLLGTFQCGFFPGFVYYMSLWYKRKEQAIRLGFFWSFSALAGAFGGFLAYGIGQIKSTYLAGWQLIFIVTSIFFVFMSYRFCLSIDRRYSNVISCVCLLVLFT
jgi:MFS family permease